MSEARTVSLFRNGRNQAVRIPVEFELPGTEAVMRKEGNVLILEAKPGPKLTLGEVLDSFGPVDFPDIDNSGLLPLDDIILEEPES